MSWTPLVERFSSLPLILAGPILRRTEPGAVTVWLALKESQRVTLRIYARNAEGNLIQQLEGTRRTVRLGDHLHIVAVTAHPTNVDESLTWGELYYYDLFFQAEGTPGGHVPATAPHLDTPGVLNIDPSSVDALGRLVYPGHPLPSFVLPAEDLSQIRIVHGSCRKPHGVGKEMLSALDAVLEKTAQDAANRPQQLFMTGDQIYADDVAASLLFALTDAGNFLLEGNEEEVLPVVDVPARMLAPGERAAIVRNKAMLTTSTPENHLLALGEYAAMYLFAWSDVLWPDDLPGAEDIWNTYPQARPQPAQREKVEATYVESIERLREFRSTLPQVRRALANIATYTICDDHDVTDDWYLDGAWCQRVLASPLGRRIVRNGLMTYALFQAWGNTPEQFAQTNGIPLIQPYNAPRPALALSRSAGLQGITFLDAVDTWRGEESDPRVESFANILGLPAPFNGSGELQRSEQALHWHYAYYGPHYQVIVMDTRTQRLYLSPGEFPGLLSPRAMQTQVMAANHEEAEVTLIISATPVLGVDFVESIQFFSRWRIRDNYSYDRESWALEWGTFQHFLKTVSAMKRVVFLSGDVHYAFGSSLEYWDYHTKATAKLINYTSSPLCNEGAGSHIAVLAVGYPQLLHLLRREGTATLDFLAWDIVAGNHHILKDVLAIIRKRLYEFWWSVPRLIAAERSPYEIVLPARGWLKGAFNAFPPDRIYRLHYLRNTLYHRGPEHVALQEKKTPQITLSRWLFRLVRLALAGVTFIEEQVRKIRSRLLSRARRVEQAPSSIPPPAHAVTHGAIKGAALLEHKLEKRRNRLVEALFHREEWLGKWKAGVLIVGYNNIGEIVFHWTPEKKDVIQRLWWWHPDDSEQPLLMTEYSDTLEPPAPETAPSLP